MKTLFLILVSIVSFAQIGAKTKTTGGGSLVGKWSNTSFGFDMKLALNADGSGSFDGERITYTSTATNLNIKEAGQTTQYQYKLNGNSLTLSGGDLDDAIIFVREGSAVSNSNPLPSDNPSKSPNLTSSSAIAGTWSGNGETMVFQTNGQGSLNNIPFSYTTSGNTLNITGSGGTSQMQFSVSGNYLTLSGNGTTVMLQKGTAYSNTKPAQSGGGYQQNSTGGIDQSLVGKWCYVSSLNNPSATSSYSRCIVINGNGTYEYYAEGSISGYGGGGYGGSSSQSSDRGTWRLAGNQIQVQSQAEGYKVYSFEKRNHPKNGEPMIIIDGDPYVTYYQKAPWR